MKANGKKWVASLLAAVTLCSAVVYPSTTSLSASKMEDFAIVQTIEASAAAVTTGDFNNNNWSGYTWVYSNNNRKSSQIKVCAFMANGKIKNGKFTIEITTPEASDFKVTLKDSGTKYITLNYGYSSYRIRIKRRGDDAENVSRTRYWSVDFTKNCRKTLF